MHITSPAARILHACIISLVAVMFAAVLACNDAEPTADLSDIAVGTGTTPADGASASDESAAQTQTGGTLKVLLGCNDSLDPAVGDCHEIYDEVYARLMAITDDPGAPVIPDLAESYSVSADGKTYTFTLHRDLKFSGGTPLTAQDFKWSWERALKPGTESAEALHVLGAIQGAADVAAEISDGLHGVTAADERTLIVELYDPSPLFLFQVADHVAAPLNQDNVKEWQDDIGLASLYYPDPAGLIPAGTGPFRFSQLGIGGKFSLGLEPNPHYHGTEPLLDEVIYVGLEVQEDSSGQIDLASTMLTMFESGELDISPFVSRDTETLDGTNTSRTLSSSIAFLAFNTAITPLDDVRVRRALIAAANVAEQQTPSAAYSLLWEGLPGFDADLAVDRYDPAMAADEIAASGRSSFDTLMLCHWSNRSGGSTIRIGVADMLADWSAQLGIEVAEADDSGEECLEDAGIIAAYIEPAFPDPHAVLGPAAAPFGEQMQGQLHEVAGIADTVSRFASFSEIERTLHENDLVLPLSQGITTIMEHVRNTVRGYAPSPYGSQYSSVWIDDTP